MQTKCATAVKLYGHSQTSEIIYILEKNFNQSKSFTIYFAPILNKEKSCSLCNKIAREFEISLFFFVFYRSFYTSSQPKQNS